ncbi:uncharacterized protein LDX57_011938 [Aspergillus melleus]|uniref:uncharacterized protein n=1 Tax=Aspergillus melleus TaxID=138277 RepID=UPI001E8E472C|nr:uncharacterized protein LDX57_011938 [Aspergillus melleus]KAH8434298.1 hypothetical protein LDX57_011938 [Aspergillus melleus]
MGCLDEPGTSHIGPFAREPLTDFVKSKISPIGPVTSRKDFNVSSVLLTMDLILREEAFTDRPIDGFLIYRFLLDCAQKILSRNEPEDGEFYLRYADDKGTHILVDEDCNITGIIDWEWAHTDTRSAAFRSPMLVLPVCDFFNGKSELGDNELLLAKSFEAKGHPELSQAVRDGRALHFFEFCCRYDVPEWRNLIRLFHGLRRTVGIDGELKWEEWKKKALKQWRNDHQLQELLSRHPRGRANRKA